MDSEHDPKPISNVVIFPPSRRNLAKSAEINFHNEVLVTYGQHRELRKIFTVERDIPIHLERGKNIDYAWHKYAPGFGVRIMRLRRPKGHSITDEFSRYYIARYREPGDKNGKKPRDVKRTLGEVGVIAFGEAQRKAKALHEDSRRARWGMPPRTETVATALESYIGIGEERLSPATIATYRKRWSVLPERWRERKMDEISPREWVDLYLQVKAKNGPETARSLARVAHAVYKRLVEVKSVADNPLTSLKSSVKLYAKPDPTGRVITAEELPSVWSWIHTKSHPSVRDFVVIGLLTGARRSILEGLRWELLNARTWTYSVPADERGNKTKKIVPLPLSDYLIEHVFKPRLAAKRPGDTWILPSPRYVDMPMRSIRGSMDAMKKEIGVPVAPHDLRRTYATIAHVATGDVLMVRRLMTHNLAASASRVANTAGYIATSDVDYRATINKVANAVVKSATDVPKESASAVEGDQDRAAEDSGPLTQAT